MGSGQSGSLAATTEAQLLLVTENAGVDDASGETQMIKLRQHPDGLRFRSTARLR